MLSYSCRLSKKTTWLKTIKASFYATWPMLTSKAACKYFTEWDEAQEGHTRQNRPGLWSTKETEEGVETHTVHIPQTKTQDIFITIEDMKQITFTDQTGKLSVVTSQDNRYIMVMCESWFCSFHNMGCLNLVNAF